MKLLSSITGSSLTVGTKLEHNNYTGFEVQPSGRLLVEPHSRESPCGAPSPGRFELRRVSTRILKTQVMRARPRGLPLYTQVNGNPQFQSEELIAYETGYRRLVTPHSYVDVALFYNDYNDLHSFQLGTPFLETSPSPALSDSSAHKQRNPWQHQRIRTVARLETGEQLGTESLLFLLGYGVGKQGNKQRSRHRCRI